MKLSGSYQEGPYYRPAGLFVRFVAWLIDACLLATLVEIFLLVIRKQSSSLLGVILPFAEQFQEFAIYDLKFGQAQALPIAFFVFIVLMLKILTLAFVYASLAECSGAGGTVGKALCGIRVVSEDSRRISIFQSILRNIFKAFSIILLCFPFLISLFNSDRQGFHDFVPNTFVVKKPRSSKIQFFFATMFSFILMSFVLILIGRHHTEVIQEGVFDLIHEVKSRGGVKGYFRYITDNSLTTSDGNEINRIVDIQEEITKGFGYVQYLENRVDLESSVVVLHDLTKAKTINADNLKQALRLDLYMFSKEPSAYHLKLLKSKRSFRNVFGRKYNLYPNVVLELYYSINEKICFTEKIHKSLFKIRSDVFDYKTKSVYQDFNFNTDSLRKQGRFAISCNSLSPKELLRLSSKVLLDVKDSTDKISLNFTISKDIN